MRKLNLESISNVASAISNNLYLRSLRDSFITTIPFLVLGGFAIIFNFILFQPETGLLSGFISTDTLATIQQIGTRLLNGSMNILGLIIAFLLAYNIAVNKKVESPHIVGLVGLAAFFVVSPLSTALLDIAKDVKLDEVIQYKENALDNIFTTSFINRNDFSATGLFMAMLSSGIAAALYIKINTIQFLKLKIEGNIPGSVKRSFDAMSSVIITLLIISLVTFAITLTTGKEISELILTTIQAPLVGLTTSLPGFLTLGFFTNFLFALGIHPAGVVNPILEPALLVAMNENVQAAAQGIEIPNIIVLPFRDVYGHIGGTGSTLALVIAIFAYSKSKANRSFAKLATPTSLFNINEPIIFGFPVIFNVFIMIPFIFAPLLNYIIAYFATKFDLVHELIVYVPWSMPPIANAYIASGGDIRNVILQVGLIVINVTIYMVFLRAYEKSQESKGVL